MCGATHNVAHEHNEKRWMLFDGNRFFHSVFICNPFFTKFTVNIYDSLNLLRKDRWCIQNQMFDHISGGGSSSLFCFFFAIFSALPAHCVSVSPQSYCSSMYVWLVFVLLDCRAIDTGCESSLVQPIQRTKWSGLVPRTQLKNLFFLAFSQIEAWHVANMENVWMEKRRDLPLNFNAKWLNTHKTAKQRPIKQTNKRIRRYDACTFACTATTCTCCSVLPYSA